MSRLVISLRFCVTDFSFFDEISVLLVRQSISIQNASTDSNRNIATIPPTMAAIIVVSNICKNYDINIQTPNIHIRKH